MVSFPVHALLVLEERYGNRGRTTVPVATNFFRDRVPGPPRGATPNQSRWVTGRSSPADLGVITARSPRMMEEPWLTPRCMNALVASTPSQR
jgi:hypothetical protein